MKNFCYLQRIYIKIPSSNALLKPFKIYNFSIVIQIGTFNFRHLYF
ncbi:hypothetical protein D778_02048 [Xanthomarina gelatinilytica]|uniref:Uncharacterized protein n=1 Tax=Xanthomarina gelatinilytica TaxID=1137281 RepID=M7NCC4_9FLAO|nr:hypothetical protein D778_02048 [Xanthomarina gelatinilytica]